MPAVKKTPTHGKLPKREGVKVKLPARLGTVRAPAANLDPGSLVLEGGPVPIQLARSVTAMVLQQTMQGASTLEITVADNSGDFNRSPVLKTAGLVLTWDGIPYTLVKSEKAERTVKLTFEESAVNLLRQYTKPKKAARALMTRAEFVRGLITEVKGARIPYAIPELKVKQPVQGGGQ
jgi:hypothetical protein